MFDVEKAYKFAKYQTRKIYKGAMPEQYDDVAQAALEFAWKRWGKYNGKVSKEAYLNALVIWGIKCYRRDNFRNLPLHIPYRKMKDYKSGHFQLTDSDAPVYPKVEGDIEIRLVREKMSPRGKKLLDCLLKEVPSGEWEDTCSGEASREYLQKEIQRSIRARISNKEKK